MSDLKLKAVIELIDRMSAPIRKVAAGVVSAAAAMRNSIGKFSDDLGFKFQFNVLLMAEKMRNMGKAFDEVSKKVKKVGREVKEAGEFFTRWFTLPLTAVSLLSLRSAANIEDMTRKFTGLAGGAKQAGDFMKRLQVFGENSPFDMGDLSDAAAQLMALGYSTKGVMDRFQLLGNIAAGSGQKMSTLTAAYIDVRKTGKLSADAILQMAQEGIPLLDTLARRLHVSRQRVMELAQAGDIGFGQFKGALKDMSFGQYADAQTKALDSIGGSWSRFMTSINDSLGAIGDIIFKQLNLAKALQWVADKVRALADWFNSLSAPMQKQIVYAGLFVAALGPLLFIIGQVTIGFSLLLKGLSLGAGILATLTEGILSFGVALLTTPLGWFAIAVGVVVGLALLLIKNWDKVKAFFVDMWAGIKDAFGAAVDWITDKLEPLFKVMDRLRDGWSSIKSAFSGPVDTIRTAATGPQDGSQQGNMTGFINPRDYGRLGGQKVDTGGTLHVVVDDNRTMVTGKTNSPQQQMSISTGLLMQGAY